MNYKEPEKELVPFAWADWIGIVTRAAWTFCILAFIIVTALGQGLQWFGNTIESVNALFPFVLEPNQMVYNIWILFAFMLLVAAFIPWRFNSPEERATMQKNEREQRRQVNLPEVKPQSYFFYDPYWDYSIGAAGPLCFLFLTAWTPVFLNEQIGLAFILLVFATGLLSISVFRLWRVASSMNLNGTLGQPFYIQVFLYWTITGLWAWLVIATLFNGYAWLSSVITLGYGAQVAFQWIGLYVFPGLLAHLFFVVYRGDVVIPIVTIWAITCILIDGYVAGAIEIWVPALVLVVISAFCLFWSWPQFGYIRGMQSWGPRALIPNPYVTASNSDEAVLLVGAASDMTMVKPHGQ